MDKVVISRAKAFRPGGYANERMVGTRSSAWAVVLVIHGLIIALWPSQYRPRVTAHVVEVMLQLLPEKQLPPAPLAEEPLELELRNRLVLRPRPLEQLPDVRQATKKPEIPTAIHNPDEQEWISPTAVDTGPVARRAPPEYAEKVKSRVISQVIYPRNALYPPPRGFKGDPRILMRECTIPYELVVDRQGRIISYDLDPCQDELLVPAAEAAILQGQPYPPPPDGAEQYRIYGSINFKKSMLAPSLQSTKQSR